MVKLFLLYKDFRIGLKINNIMETVPYQLCPKCNGQGIVSKPPGIAGDVEQWSHTQTSFTCDVCNGAKIILQYSIPDNVTTIIKTE